ncbi:MAG: SDR family oxidoreductase [Pseudomonadota bacterium]
MNADLFDMSDETVLITGAGTGLGQRFAETLAGAGANIILSGRRLEKLEESAHAVTEKGGTAYCIPMDVSDGENVRASVAEAMKVSPVTVLVNNAGTVSGDSLVDLPEGRWDSVIDTNLKGAWLVASQLAGHLKSSKRSGAIVNIASVLGSSVQKMTGAYCASKAGLLHLTRHMALEWSEHQLRVNAIAPGYYKTDISAGYLDSAQGKAMTQRIPMRRLGECGELDAAILMLASSASSYMTGSVITVDGGLSLSII